MHKKEFSGKPKQLGRKNVNSIQAEYKGWQHVKEQLETKILKLRLAIFIRGKAFDIGKTK
ncbi:3094_t:CDS:2, partial [Rhizophagus irregularis]